ncbi:MAG: putative sigma-54 modulation protein [Lentisphaeria bacterium]|jgi:putative sigma-54 modulation protein
MQIELSGHHVDITDSIRESVTSKLAKIESHHPQIGALTVIITVEPNIQRIEITTNYMGSAIAVQAKEKDLYAAIASAAKKLDAQLSHKKGTAKAFKHEKPELDEPEDTSQIQAL